MVRPGRIDELIAEDCVVYEAASEWRQPRISLEVLDEGSVGEATRERHRESDARVTRE